MAEIPYKMHRAACVFSIGVADKGSVLALENLKKNKDVLRKWFDSILERYNLLNKRVDMRKLLEVVEK